MSLKTIIWRGILYNSIEHFNISDEGSIIYAWSKIRGTYDGNVYTVEYSMKMDLEWRIFNFDIVYEINGNKNGITGNKEDGNWKLNGKTDNRFANVDFIDISLTPFTNTLPVKVLNLSDAEERNIDVIYIDILEGSVKPVKQKYRKNSDSNYTFENVPNDFEADIEVDQYGFVTLYPGLFERG